jgi:hypothetical protein
MTENYYPNIIGFFITIYAYNTKKIIVTIKFQDFLVYNKTFFTSLFLKVDE